MELLWGTQPLIDASPTGKLTYISETCKGYSGAGCDLWTDEPHIPTWYKRRVGCFHWMFRKWYVFLKSDRTDNKYKLSSFDGETGELCWEEISWKILELPPAKYFPVDLKCPQLHSFLIWSELDHGAMVHVMKIELDHTTGEPINHIQELQQDKLCDCSHTHVITIPILELVYRNLDQPAVAELDVLCHNTICGATLTSDVLQSTVAYRNEKSTAMIWFAMDQTYVVFILRSNNGTELFVDYIGNESAGIRETTESSMLQIIGHHTLRYQGHQSAHQREGFYSVHVPKDEQLLPVPPKKCIIPQIHETTNFEMSTMFVAHIRVKVVWNDTLECRPYAKPLLFCVIQYLPWYGNHGEHSLKCKNDTLLSLNPKYEGLDCQTRQTKPSRNSTLEYMVGNLIPDAKYFFQISLRIDIGAKLSNLWLAGANMPSKRMIVNTKYTAPRNNNNWQLAVAMPVTVLNAMLIVSAAVFWWYNQKFKIYQHLMRLSPRDIHREVKLGEGNFGEAWKASMGKDTIVVKLLKESATDREEKELREEALLLSKHSDALLLFSQ